MEVKIAFVGKKAFVLPFLIFSKEIYPVEDSFEAKKIIKELEKKGFRIVFLTEELAKELLSEIEKRLYTIKIMIIPSYIKKDIGILHLNNIIKKAIGTTI